jgi:hypothetical protein
MPNSNGVFKTILLLSAMGILGACGGGGGGGGGTTVGIAASDPVTVNAANALAVVSSTLDASDGLTGNTEGTSGLVALAAAGQTQSVQINVIETIIEQARKAPVLFPSGPSGVTPAAVQSLNQNCDSGTISGSFNDADNDLTLSTGDTVSMTANNCSLDGVTMNGSISLSNVSVTGDEFSPPYSLQFTLQATNFSVSVGGETVVMRGDGTISESSSDGINYTSVSGNGIEITAGGESLILTDYDIQETETPATGAYSISINATISSSGLGGSVTVRTDVALTGVGALDPDSGRITCVGADNTSMTLIVVDSIVVQLDVDQDGDGIIDETLFPAWADL